MAEDNNKKEDTKKRKLDQNAKADPIDVHVGEQLRLQRQLMGMSQKSLGKAVGVSFQQIQKYEGAFNRICASRLFKLAEILKVDVAFFFEGVHSANQQAVQGAGFREDSQRLLFDNMTNSKLGLELNRAFAQLKDPKKAKLAVDIVKQFIDGDDES